MWRTFSISLVTTALAILPAQAVKLRWDPPATGEPTGYVLYRGMAIGQACNPSAQPVMELYGVAPIGLQPEFVDQAPVVGATYYEVTAHNSEGESLPSNRVCYQRQAAVTSAPQNLRIEP